MDDVAHAETWHFHVRGPGLQACITGIDADTEDEAADAALDEFVHAWYSIDPAGDGDLERLFGNANLTWCGGSGDCDCGLAVHAVRMPDVDASEVLAAVTAEDGTIWIGTEDDLDEELLAQITIRALPPELAAKRAYELDDSSVLAEDWQTYEPFEPGSVSLN
jgi:hypothetical protein